MKTIKIKKLVNKAKLPFQSRASDTGYDLTVTQIEDLGNFLKINTGIAIEMPEGIWAMLAPRSSLHKKGLMLYNSVGIIDNEYRGELILMLLKTKDYSSNKLEIGDRVAQLIFMNLLPTKLLEVEELTESTRQDRGFGSTGK